MRSSQVTQLLKAVQHHERLYFSIAIGTIVGVFSAYAGVKSHLGQSLVGFNSGALIYVGWASLVMYRSTIKDMRARALAQDDGKVVVLSLAVLALVFSIGAIFADLASVKTLAGSAKYGTLLLALLTISSSWFFTNTVFALHYAHDYYFDFQNGKTGGLVFLPSDEEPTYSDFIYFSFILGATAQTADVVLSSKKMRRTCTLHSILAFFFNTTILALTVNMASGLL